MSDVSSATPGGRWLRPARSALAAAWALDPAVVFLNHGSFGACPRVVLDAQAALRDEMEANPVRFLARGLEERLARARAVVAEFVGADPEDLAFVPNATHAISTVLRSLHLGPGDEIVANDHEYNAVLNAARAVAAPAGARVTVVPLSLPVTGPEAVAGPILGAVGPRTRLVILSHVTSPTAIVLPVERIVAVLEPAGIPVLVDGAHAPGMVALSLDRLGASYYAGNLHKWCCAPKGAAILHVRRDRRAGIRPLAISHGANDPRADRSLLRREFDWTGTADPTPCLVAPIALAALAALDPSGWPGVMARNRGLALEGRDVLLRVVGGRPLVPEPMLGAMAAVALPPPTAWPPSRRVAASPDADPIQAQLLDRFGIEVPVFAWPREGGPDTPRVRLVRISAHLHNAPDEFRALGDALAELLSEGM